MKLVYAASNTIEAHMILNLLEQAEISARIDGEYLQGGVGDLQASGFARVMVDESDYEAAKVVVDDWDANQPDEEAIKPPEKSSSFLIGVFGFIAGVIVTTIFCSSQ